MQSHLKKLGARVNLLSLLQKFAFQPHFLLSILYFEFLCLHLFDNFCHLVIVLLVATYSIEVVAIVIAWYLVIFLCLPIMSIISFVVILIAASSDLKSFLGVAQLNSTLNPSLIL